MVSNNLKYICNIIGVTGLSRLLNQTIGSVSRQNIHEFINRGYAPPDWYYVLVQVSDGEVTFNDLYTELYKHKRKCKLKHVTLQITRFKSDMQKKQTFKKKIA